MSDARYSHRHRPGHHALRAVLRGHERERRRKDRAEGAADRPAHGPRRDRQPRSAALVPLPAASGRTGVGRPAPAVDRPARVRGRRVRAQPRRGHADPARVEREELAVPSGRRSPRGDPAQRRAARSRARLAARKLGALSDASARSLGPRASRRAVQRAGHHGDDPRVVRRGRARADRRSRRSRRPRPHDAARRAAGRVLWLDRRAAASGGSRSRSATSSSWSTSAAARPTSR